MRTWSRNPGAGNRARAELYRDPARSDEVIAPLARCTAPTVAAIRRELEDAGTVRRVPVSDRAPRQRPVPPSRTRDAIARLGPDATPREVASAAGVSIQAAWKALRDLRAAGRASRLPPELAGGRCAVVTSAPLWDSADPADRELAALVCTAECRVLNACLIWAVLNEPGPGVYGGFTAEQRARIARAAALPPRRRLRGPAAFLPGIRPAGA